MRTIKKYCIEVTNNSASIICTILALFSLWIILIVGLNLPYLVPSVFDNETNSYVNIILLNLSYSYVAGCIFYFFTSYLPNLIKMSKIMGGIKIKIGEIDRIMHEMFYAFNRGNVESYEMDAICKNKEVCIDVLMSKDWNSIIVESIYLNRTTSYLSRISYKHKELKEAVTSLIDTYKEYFTADQLSMCEEIRGSSLMYRFELFSSLNVKYDPKAIMETSEDIYEELHKILKLKTSINKRFSKWDNYK